MKHQLIKLILLTVSIFAGCAEKSGSNSNSTALTALLSIQNGCNTTATTVTSISSTSRTQYDFSVCNNPSALTGFTVENITSGLNGTSTTSKLGSTGTFGSSANKINIEVTYTLSSSSSYLDIVALGTGTGTSLSGPGFRISPSDVKYTPTSGTPTTFGTGSSPTSTVGVSKSVCLEVHQEGSGSHIFGWNGTCTAVTNLGTYTFDQENVVGTISDRKIGFTLNNVILTKIIVSNGALGTAGSLQSF